MDLINLIILLISLLIEKIDSVLIKQIDRKDLQIEHVVYNADEPSLLQCVQRCRYIDKDSAIDFKDSTCRCVRYKTNGQNNEGTLTGLFGAQKIMKIPQKPLKLMNVALKKPAKQSSKFNKLAQAEKGNDGIDVGAMTPKEINQWWQVDLQDVFKIETMHLSGATQKWHNRGLIVETKMTEKEGWMRCKDIGDLDKSPITFVCDQPTYARYVRIRASVRCNVSVKELTVNAYTNEY